MQARNKLALAMSVLLFASVANAQQKGFELNIEAQPLNRALTELADKTGIQIVYESQLVAGITSQSLSGTMSPDDAVRTLLRGSGLKATRLNDRAIAIAKDGTPAPPSGKPRAKEADAPTAEGGTPTPGQAQIDAGDTDDVTSLAKIVVTGSYIRGANETGSPLVVISRAEIDRSGYATLKDILSTATANAGGGPHETIAGGLEQGTNFNAGTGVNLRGLGASSTLVLVNGRRQPAGGLDGRFTDISSIPSSAVDRIEILTDGASAIYGSDAVGGVVNVILRTDFEGAETRMRVGSAGGGGDDRLFAQLFGTNWEGGNLMASYQYLKRESVPHSERDFAADSDKRPLGGTNFSNAWGNPGNILDPVTFEPLFAIPRGQNGQNLTPGDLLPGVVNYQNYFEGADLLPSQTTHSAFATWTQDIGDRLSVSAEVRASTRRMERLDVSRAWPNFVPNTNPFFVDPFGGSEYVVVGYSFFDDLGARPTVSDTRTYSGSASATLELGERWLLDGYASYGRESIRWESRNIVNGFELSRALADPNPETAFNPFGDGSFTNPETLERIKSTQFEKALSTTRSANLTAQGPVADLPGGEVLLAVGSEYRWEETDRLEYIVDFDRVDQYDPPPGKRTVGAAFAELQVPIVGESNRRAGIHSLNLSLAGRYEKYSDFGSTFNPKFGISWSPTPALQFRGTYGTSFRAPNLMDLQEDSAIVPSASQLTVVPDPTSATGTSRIISLYGNNADLHEETATSWTAGVDFSPRGDEGIRLSLTYFDVEYEDRIERGGPISGTYDIFSEEDIWAPIITRNPDQAVVNALCNSPNFFGSIEDCLRQPAPTIVDARVRNLGVVKVNGVDFQSSYRGITEGGSWGVSLDATRILTFDQATTATSPLFDLLDSLNGPLSWKVRAGAFGTMGAFSLSGFVNYQNSYTDQRSNPTRRIDSLTTLDLRAAYRFGAFEDGKGTEISLNVSNATDEEPPFVNTLYGYDQSNGDPLGRVVSLQLTTGW